MAINDTKPSKPPRSPVDSAASPERGGAVRNEPALRRPRPPVGRLALSFLLVYALAVLSGGCVHIQRLLGALFQQPSLHFESASVRDVSLGGLTLDLEWRVENPNDVGVRIDELSYAFDVEGSRLTSGVQPKGVDVAAGGSSSVTLPFEVRFTELADSVFSLLRSDVIGWSAEGSMGFDTPVGMLKVPFSREGETPLPRLPEVRLSGARLSNVSLSGATMTVDLGLRNPNAFAVPVDRLTYAFRVAGADVASGTARPPRLQPGAETSFSIPVQVSFSSAGRAVYEAVQSGQAEIGVRGGLVSGSLDMPVDLSRRMSLR